MPSWKKIITSGSNAALNTLNVTTALTASGLNYPTTDNGEESFLQTNGSGNLSFQYVKTIYEKIYNGEATSISKGTPLYVSGSVGAASVVYRADASIPSKMPVIYVAADNIASGNTGRGIVLGLIKGVNTTGYPAGTEIFVAPGGGWTSTRPTGSNIVQLLGIITKEGAGGQGIILNPGPFNLPNLTSGNVWVGNNNSIPTPTTTSSLNVFSAVSSSFATTASYILNAVSASFSTTSSFSLFAVSSSRAVSSSFAISSSFATNGFPFTGSAIITGSLIATGSTIFNGLNTIQGTVSTDNSITGSELLTTGTSDASWTGTSFVTGYTHVVGSTTTLTSTVAAVINNFYLYVITVTGRTAGSFSISFGGSTFTGLTGNGQRSSIATTTDSLVITPTSDFNGTIVLSLRIITPSSASVTYLRSDGGLSNQLRINLDPRNVFLGNSAGRNNFSGNNLGIQNTFIGAGSGRDNITGRFNTYIGNEAGRSGIEVSNNVAVGGAALLVNINGSGNSVLGVETLSSLTAGSNNVAVGNNAGRFITGGVIGNTISNNSIFIGTSTRAQADNQTNQIVIGNAATGLGSNTTVIGNTSTTSTAIYGDLLLGTTTDNGTDRLQISGSARISETLFTGPLISTGSARITGSLGVTGNITSTSGITGSSFTIPGGTPSQFLKADGSIDSNAYALQDGTILYHSARWFTPTSTVSTSGTTVTSVGTQFTSAMVGAKLTINGESRIITAFVSSTVVTVASAYSVNYSGVAAANWGVFSRAYASILGNDTSNFFGITGNRQFYLDVNSNTIFSSTFTVFSGNLEVGSTLINSTQLSLASGNRLVWSNDITNEQLTKDLGLRRNAPGVLEIYDGVTATGLEANRRDLLVRNTFSSRIIAGSTVDNGIDRLQVSGSTNLNGNTIITGSLGVTGSISNTTSITSPIFYDSANTDYYFDGSNTGNSIQVAGDIVGYFSDDRLKDRKGNIPNAIEKVQSLNGFYYKPNKTAQEFGYKNQLEIGVSAQEVEKVLPEIIKDAPIGHGYKTLNYGRLTPLLVEAIKEQQKQIEELKELVNKLINK